MKILVIILALFLVGCEKVEYTGANSDLREHCINGVVYYEYVNAIIPAFKTDGTLYLCNKR